MAMRPIERAAGSATPALVKGRGRLRVLGALFALAFLSIGLRLLDMVGWQAEGTGRAAVVAGADEPVAALGRLSPRPVREQTVQPRKSPVALARVVRGVLTRHRATGAVDHLPLDAGAMRSASREERED